MHWPLTMRFGPVMPHPAIAWAGGYKLPNAGFVPKISDWATGAVHINRLESTGSAAIALVVILRNITIGSLAPDAPAVWFKNAKNIHFQNVMIAGHAIKQLHAVARYHGQDVILAWKPYPNAARYIAFVLLCSCRRTCAENFYCYSHERPCGGENAVSRHAGDGPITLYPPRPGWIVLILVPRDQRILAYGSFPERTWCTAAATPA